MKSNTRQAPADIAVIGVDADGGPTFNGRSRTYIVNYCYQNLNYYQMTCKPRVLEPEQDDSDEYIDQELFEKIKEAAFLCPVCTDVYKHPLNVKQCLHKFCGECIQDYNRKVKKECPACRHQIGSRRLLRNDMRTEMIISSLITDVDQFNKLQQREREMECQQFDFDGFNEKMRGLQAQQETILQMERLEKIETKQKKKRDIIERRLMRKEAMNNSQSSSDQSDSDQTDCITVEQGVQQPKDNRQAVNQTTGPLLKQKRPYVMKRQLEEENVHEISVEFIIKQETQMPQVCKEVLFKAQFIRTQSNIKVIDLKKHILQTIKENHPDTQFLQGDIQFLKYMPQGEIFLRNELTIQELILKNILDENRTKIFKKKELVMEDNPRLIDTIWVCINKL